MTVGPLQREDTMKHHEARVGDIVRLTGGGPDMRVFAYDGGGNLHCEWKGTDGPMEATFNPEVLDMVAQRSKEAASEGDAQALDLSDLTDEHG